MAQIPSASAVATKSNDDFSYTGCSKIYGRVVDVLFFEDGAYVVFLIMSALIMAPVVCVTIPLMNSVAPSIERLDESGFQSPTMILQILPGMIGYGVKMIAYIGHGPMIQGVADIYVGRKMEWTACFRALWNHFGSLVCAGFIVTGTFHVIVLALRKLGYVASFTKIPWLFSLLLFVLVALVIGYFYVMILATLIFPAIMMDHDTSSSGFGKGIQYALKLSGGRWCVIVTPCLIFFVFRFWLECVLYLLFEEYPLDRYAGKTILLHTLPEVFLYMPFLATLESVIYLNLRIVKDGIGTLVPEQELGLLPDANSVTNHASLVSSH
jgi:hypothetical protein